MFRREEQMEKKILSQRSEISIMSYKNIKMSSAGNPKMPVTVCNAVISHVINKSYGIWRIFLGIC